MIFLIGIMSFANFVFYPLVVGSIIAVIIEQILRSKGNEYDPKAVARVELLWFGMIHLTLKRRELC